MPGTQKITTENTEYTEKEAFDALTGDIHILVEESAYEACLMKAEVQRISKGQKWITPYEALIFSLCSLCSLWFRYS